MHDDRLLDLACAVISCAVTDYCAQIPGYNSHGLKDYQRRVDEYLTHRKSARKFFNSPWFGILSLGQDGAKVMQYYDEKGVGHRVNNK